MPTTTYIVSGMTGRQCADFVSAELAGLPGVDQVDVDPIAGTASVTGAEPLDPALVHAAVPRCTSGWDARPSQDGSNGSS